MARYRYVVLPNTKTIICISTYAKKIVKGVATCSDQDKFNEETGKQLAKLRCDVKVAKKRLNRSIGKLKDANTMIDEAEVYREKMAEYMLDSKREYELAVSDLDKFEKSIGFKL